MTFDFYDLLGVAAVVSVVAWCIGYGCALDKLRRKLGKMLDPF